jgi:hypothetical protein
VLTPADLPGYSAAPQSDDSNDKALDACGSPGRSHYLARNGGLAFTRGDTEIDSSADVVDNAAVGRADFVAIRKAVPCIRAAFKKEIQAEADGGKVVDFHFDATTATVPRADEALRFDLSVTLSMTGVTATITGYVFGALVNNVEVSVTEIGLGAPPLPLGELTSLMSTVGKRVRAVA